MTTITVTVRDDDPEELDSQARLLRDELDGLDVDGLEFAPGAPAPEDAKGVDPATLTTIIVTLSGSPVLIQLGRVLRDFVANRKRRVVVRDGKRSLEINGPLDESAKQAIESFFEQKQIES